MASVTAANNLKLTQLVFPKGHFKNWLGINKFEVTYTYFQTLYLFLKPIRHLKCKGLDSQLLLHSVQNGNTTIFGIYDKILSRLEWILTKCHSP